MADFRRATNEFKTNLEREVRMDELKDAVRPIETARSPETLARGVLLDAIAPVTPEAAAAPSAPATPAEPETPAALEGNPEINGGPGSVH